MMTQLASNVWTPSAQSRVGRRLRDRGNHSGWDLRRRWMRGDLRLTAASTGLRALWHKLRPRTTRGNARRQLAYISYEVSGLVNVQLDFSQDPASHVGVTKHLPERSDSDRLSKWLVHVSGACERALHYDVSLLRKLLCAQPHVLPILQERLGYDTPFSELDQQNAPSFEIPFAVSPFPQPWLITQQANARVSPCFSVSERKHKLPHCSKEPGFQFGGLPLPRGGTVSDLLFNHGAAPLLVRYGLFHEQTASVSVRPLPKTATVCSSSFDDDGWCERRLACGVRIVFAL